MGLTFLCTLAIFITICFSALCMHDYWAQNCTVEGLIISKVKTG